MIEKNFLTKDMKKIMIKVKILKLIGSKRTYSYAITKEIAQSKHMARFFSGKGAVKDEVYNTINALEKSGYIRLVKQPKSGRVTNYYAITKEGKSVLDDTKKVFASSMKEISKIFK